MSVLNQPTFRSGTLIRKIDTTFTSSAASISQVLPMGNNVTSCQFATSDTSVITITQSGKYRIYFISYTNIAVQSQGGGVTSQFRIEAGSSIFGVAETVGSTFSHNFSASQYVDFGSYTFSGFLPAYTGNASITGGFAINCYLSANTEIILNTNDQIRLYITKSFPSSGISYNAALNGYIFVEQIS